MEKSLSDSAQIIQQFLKNQGITSQVIEFSASTRTAAEAAATIGCLVAQIAKSILFVTAGKNPVLVIASGAHRINEATIEKLVGEPVKKADAQFTRETTGFVIGGVPPFGHMQKIQTFIDDALLKFPQIWAAAGTPYASFCLESAQLVQLTSGRIISVE